MHHRRFIALLLTLLTGLVLCTPDRPDSGRGPLRHGKYVSHGSVQIRMVRADRSSRPDPAGHRRSGERIWSSGPHGRPAQAAFVLRAFTVRSVDTLPSHWGARHLTI